MLGRIYITVVKLRKLLKLFVNEGENEVDVRFVCQDAFLLLIDFTFFTYLLTYMLTDAYLPYDTNLQPNMSTTAPLRKVKYTHQL